MLLRGHLALRLGLRHLDMGSARCERALVFPVEKAALKGTFLEAVGPVWGWWEATFFCLKLPLEIISNF